MIQKMSRFDKFNGIKARTGHGWQDIECRTWIAGYGLQVTDMDMDRRTWIRTWIAGQGLQDMDTDMNCRTWIRTWIAGHGHGHGYGQGDIGYSINMISLGRNQSN